MASIIDDYNYRELKLEKLGFPQEYIDVYMYIITGDNSYLPSDYFVEYPTKTVVNSPKIRKAKEELLILALRCLIYGDLR